MFLFRSNFYVKSFYQRFERLVRHLFFDDFGLNQSAKLMVLKYVPGAVLLTLDLIAVPELYDWLSNFWKTSSRELSDKEKEFAASVFYDVIPLDEVRIDTLANIGPSQLQVVYVSFFTINSHGSFGVPTLIHELVHVWQYMRFGSLYIIHALAAQRSKMGYNYGGLNALKEAREKGKSILTFNFEQQADIVRDYFLICQHCPAQWSQATISDIHEYEHFLNEIREIK